MIEVVSFDFWNTLIFYTDPVPINKKKVDVLYKLTGKDRKVLLSVVEQVEEEVEKEREATSIEISSSEVTKRIVQKLGCPSIYERFRKAYDEILLNSFLELEETALETFKALIKRNKKIALLSNTSHGHVLRKILKKKGVLRYFDFLLFSDELGYRKPHIKVFEALVELSHTEPSSILHIGDRCDLDVVGAKNAGFKTVWYSNSDGECKLYDFRVDKLKKILEVL